MVDYKNTLHLPKTGFPMRAGLAQREPATLEAWTRDGLYERILERRRNAELYVLHDGPPYANGHLHHGHILNKVLKDFVVKDRTLAGYRVPYVPGWDCHGLPIEQQVDQRLGDKKKGMSKAEVIAACRAYADEFINHQREEFVRLGVLGRWQAPYKTMLFAYEAQIVRELARFVENGLVYKGLRSVNWCPKHQTALAEAEIEYEDHDSPSIYVAFPVAGDATRLGIEGEADLLIWTTTPWTLPGNLAIALHAELDYVLYPIQGRPRLIAKGLAESVLAALKEPELDAAAVLGTYKGADLEGLTYRHPLFDRTSPVILADHVTLEAGTGCVHTAPGHGAEDFDVGRKYGLEVLSPVDPAGCFTEEAGPWAGMKVTDANPKIVATLKEQGALLNEPGEQILHRYAHCWRCHTPILMRATEQWWVAIDKPFAGGPSLRERALAAVDEVEWVPKWGENRIRGMLEARPDWCLSRQRSWGVPIPVLYCAECGHAHLSADFMNRVADRFEEEGMAAWREHDASVFAGDLACAECGGRAFRKEEDILDVWFDSGVSWAAVIEREGLGHREGTPIDLYLEGSDQHRGWFHTSLLCSLATRGRSPYRKVITHGFVVDGDGKKVSKSKGNFIDPFEAIQKNGAEILRLWVAAEDFREDIRISEEILKRLTDTYRKVRNTFRYVLGSLDGFDPNAHLVTPDQLRELDRYGLAMVNQAVERMLAAYRTATYHIVVQTMNELCTVELSSFYFEILKDRLYCSGADSVARRSAQTALYLIGRDLLRVLSPILCFTTEEAWGFLPRLAGDPDSVHLSTYPGLDEPEPVTALRAAVSQESAALLERYGFVREIRTKTNAALEAARQDKRIGKSVAADLTVRAPAEIREKLAALGEAPLADLFIVSHVTLAEASGDEVEVEVAEARGTKCERCWLYREDVGGSDTHPTLCSRCAEAVPS